MNIFIKYKIPLNIVLMLFWLFIIYEGLSSQGFSTKIIIPILFVILAIFNIFKSTNPNKTKSED
jgi:hypothetical protein